MSRVFQSWRGFTDRLSAGKDAHKANNSLRVRRNQRGKPFHRGIRHRTCGRGSPDAGETDQFIQKFRHTGGGALIRSPALGLADWAYFSAMVRASRGRPDRHSNRATAATVRNSPPWLFSNFFANASPASKLRSSRCSSSAAIR